MTVQLNPHLRFRDNARQAMEFYHSVLGGELTLSTFAEMQAAAIGMRCPTAEPSR